MSITVVTQTFTGNIKGGSKPADRTAVATGTLDLVTKCS